MLGLVELPMSAAHAEQAACRCADPFDRMLIAQAQVKGYTLVSRASAFGAYGVDTIPY